MLKRHLFGATILAMLVGGAGLAHAVPAVGLTTGNVLFDFDVSTPGSVSGLRSITGLGAGERLYSIDYRPATNALYALGSTGSLYTISATGVATLASTLSTSLSGTDFDISFNPTVDRLRIVSNTGQNLRVDVSTGGATVDGALNYAAADVYFGRMPSIVGAAYTNQVAGAAATVLYDLDSAAGALLTQSPPNNGTLNTIASTSPAGLVSFDIDPNGNVGYAATASTLYRINLTTGATTSMGAFGVGSVTDFAIAPAAAVPEPMTLALLGTGLAGLVAARRRARPA